MLTLDIFIKLVQQALIDNFDGFCERVTDNQPTKGIIACSWNRWPYTQITFNALLSFKAPLFFKATKR